MDPSGWAVWSVIGEILGFTRHGVIQVIGREGHGVSVAAILDALRNGEIVVDAVRGTTKLATEAATVVVSNTTNKIVTAWPRSSAGYRGGATVLAVGATVAGGLDAFAQLGRHILKRRMMLADGVRATDPHDEQADGDMTSWGNGVNPHESSDDY